MARDVDAGQSIASVTLSLRILAGIEGLLRSGAPLPLVQSTAYGDIEMSTKTIAGQRLTYKLTVDTANYLGTGLPPAHYTLVVDATSTNGATNRVSFHHIIDNG